MVERTFKDIPEDKINEADQQSFLVSLGWSRDTTWEDLLLSKRVLMISEAGAGKTHECRNQARRLWDAGEPAFFVELTGLGTGDLRSLLDADEEARLESWLSSQSDVATFFLDSIDELKLSLSSFEVALKRFKKGIRGQLGRVRIVITTRPIPFDEQLVRRVLPILPASMTEPSEESFAKIAMGDHRNRQDGDTADNVAPDWRTVGLMPLSDTQIVEFSKAEGVQNPAALLADLENRNAQEFARRPQDLIELCADWRQHKRIRTHRDQVAANVRVKLQARDDRPEPAELAVDRAIEGASRLALAMLVTRRMTVRHSAASDEIKHEAALDPTIILYDWNPNEQKALLERPLFGFASYGRVRLHHRSVADYLAAERLRVLRKRGMTFRALRRLLFTRTRGKTIVRPSMRPIAGWLALMERRVFELLRENEPAVLLDEGDPESLSQLQRNQALSAYVQFYGTGGWRGLSVPRIQVHRFASPKLSDVVAELWEKGIENPEVRETLLHLVEAGRINDCGDIAFSAARDIQASAVERLIAVKAMVAIRDPRLKVIASDVAAANPIWPQKLAEGAVVRLFPQDLSIDQLCQTLSWIKEGKRGVGDLGWQLPRLIANAKLDPASLEALRDGLVELLSDGLRWNKEWPHVTCDRRHLSGALASTCMQGLDRSRSEGWLYASVLALRLHDREYVSYEPHERLQACLTKLASDENERLFWADDRLVQSLRPVDDPWKRYAEIILHEGPVQLRADRDLKWIKGTLSDKDRSMDDRALLLEAAARLAPKREQWRNHVSALKPLVADQPGLLSAIEDWLKPSKYDEEDERRKRRQDERKKQQERKEAKIKALWIQFWREVAERPETAFSSERSWDTAWKLWEAMSRDGEESRESGWNRRFIEEHFGKETADRLRRTLKKVWRKDRPSLSSERAEEDRGTYLARWRLGHAGLYAEAEDPQWATKLTEEDAERAARYAPIELNGFPGWLESLADARPEAVDAILGSELTWELNRDPRTHGHSLLLQYITYAPDLVAKVFLPRLREWLDSDEVLVDGASAGEQAAERFRQVIGVLLKCGDGDARERVGSLARQQLKLDLPEELIVVWLWALMHVEPALGVSEVEDRIRTVEPAARSEAVKWFSDLFGDRQRGINLRAPAFSPQLLLCLLRLAYRHVRPAEDVNHESAYSPDMRDHAERARSSIVNALLDTKGEEGWAAKTEAASDPLCAHFKDRILAVSEEHWAQEIDSAALGQTQAVALDQTNEAPPSTNEAMFALMNDRLADLDDLLLSDASPREAWAGITVERIMRREIARELGHAANGLYKVDQEAVKADEKKTDIRLRSVVSEHEAVIELKLGDSRSARALRDTIKNQLVKKYMAAENARSGCLLVIRARKNRWIHPDTNALIDSSELRSVLHQEAKRVEEEMGGMVAVSVHLLDLHPRVPSEKKGRNDRRGL